MSVSMPTMAATTDMYHHTTSVDTKDRDILCGGRAVSEGARCRHSQAPLTGVDYCYYQVRSTPSPTIPLGSHCTITTTMLSLHYIVRHHVLS